MQLKALLVDDEPLARELLRSMLQGHADVTIVGECANGDEAIDALQDSSINLLFLDVQMPEIDGFDVVEEVGVENLPSTIFVTAFQEHAVRAFDVQAIDYLTKPIVPERLGRALRRVREKLESQTTQLTQEQLNSLIHSVRAQNEAPKTYAVRFLVRDGEREILLPVSDIDWVEADAYYSRLHVNGKHYMLRESITDLNNKLDPTTFVRVHRSSIVNVERIREVYREGRSDSSLVLKSGSVLKMSRQGRQRLIDLGR
ncbi:two component transcriptional regulator, LytTR family [Bryocella elongata]|uniref:Two component transcriptional regulator, LytTR family n=1 Tax=Bryocella elongata TaxID=863522 RepID=A0A1H6CI51_9BACT|nr:response regulator [Bryocella elongata]SEG72355.1 two component transcriptional regulator, LytTR family [Bryocella elongata]